MKRLIILLLCLLPVLPGALAEAPAAERLPEETLCTFYDDSLFVGDSLMVGFRLYVRGEQGRRPAYFSGIRFCAADSYLLHSASTEAPSGAGPELRINGRSATLARIMQELQPRRVFILAGLNDDIHDHLDRADRYIDRIMALRDKYAPETEMCFFSLVPVTRRVGPTRQSRMDAYNAWLEQKCARVGAVYVDIASGLKGPDGFLPDRLCRDGRFHLNRDGNMVWARELLDYAQRRYEAGEWEAVRRPRVTRIVRQGP